MVGRAYGGLDERDRPAGAPGDVGPGVVGSGAGVAHGHAGGPEGGGRAVGPEHGDERVALAGRGGRPGDGQAAVRGDREGGGQLVVVARDAEAHEAVAAAERRVGRAVGQEPGDGGVEVDRRCRSTRARAAGRRAGPRARRRGPRPRARGRARASRRPRSRGRTTPSARRASSATSSSPPTRGGADGVVAAPGAVDRGTAGLVGREAGREVVLHGPGEGVGGVGGQAGRQGLRRRAGGRAEQEGEQRERERADGGDHRIRSTWVTLPSSWRKTSLTSPRPGWNQLVRVPLPKRKPGWRSVERTAIVRLKRPAGVRTERRAQHLADADDPVLGPVARVARAAPRVALLGVGGDDRVEAVVHQVVRRAEAVPGVAAAARAEPREVRARAGLPRRRREVAHAAEAAHVEVAAADVERAGERRDVHARGVVEHVGDGEALPRPGAHVPGVAPAERRARGVRERQRVVIVRQRLRHERGALQLGGAGLAAGVLEHDPHRAHAVGPPDGPQPAAERVAQRTGLRDLGLDLGRVDAGGERGHGHALVAEVAVDGRDVVVGAADRRPLRALDQRLGDHRRAGAPEHQEEAAREAVAALDRRRAQQRELRRRLRRLVVRVDEPGVRLREVGEAGGGDLVRAQVDLVPVDAERAVRAGRDAVLLAPRGRGELAVRPGVDPGGAVRAREPLGRRIVRGGGARRGGRRDDQHAQQDDRREAVA